MSRSSFTRGNARKLLSLPLYGLGFLATLVIPRQSDRWVFGCGTGVGEGALELFHQASSDNGDLSLTWLARDAHDLEAAVALGIEAVPKNSARGLWATLRAEVIVITHGFGDANRYGTRGGFIVQLWHGTPLKLLQLDSPSTMRSPILPRSWVMRRLLHLMYARASSAIRLMPAASPIAAGRLRSAFGLPPGRVVVTGDPRDDVLCRGTRAERTERADRAISRLLPLAGLDEPRILLYAPTWRDGDVDPGIPTDAAWQRIADFLLATDSVLVIRPHPLGVGEYLAGTTRSNRIMLLPAAQQGDITPLLPAVDILITDYSSIAYDFALTGGTILFFAPDQRFYEESRGLYQPYSEFSGGSEVDSWDGVLGLLARHDTDRGTAARLQKHGAMLERKYQTFRDGRNAERVYSEIVKRLRTRAR